MKERAMGRRWRRLPVGLILAISLAAACGSEETPNRRDGAAQPPASEGGNTPAKETPSSALGTRVPTSHTAKAPSPIPKGPAFGGPAGPFTVTYEGNAFEPVAGPFRSETFDLDSLSETGLILSDEQVKQGADGDPVFAIGDRPLEEGFLVRSGPRADGVVNVDQSYLSCQPGSGAFVFTTTGASVDHPLFGPPANTYG